MATILLKQFEIVLISDQLFLYIAVKWNNALNFQN